MQLQPSTLSASLSGKTPPMGKMPEAPWPTITVRTNWSPSGWEEETVTLFQVETYVAPLACVRGLLPFVAVRLKAMPAANRWPELSQSSVGSPEFVSPLLTSVEVTP